MTKLLPGWFGFRPTRGLVNRGWKIPKLRSSTGTLLAKLSVILSRVRWTMSKTWCCTIPVWLLIATTMSRFVSFAILPKNESFARAQSRAQLAKKSKFFGLSRLRARADSDLVRRRRTPQQTVQVITERRLLGQILALRFKLALHQTDFGEDAVPIRFQ